MCISECIAPSEPMSVMVCGLPIAGGGQDVLRMICTGLRLSPALDADCVRCEALSVGVVMDSWLARPSMPDLDLASEALEKRATIGEIRRILQPSV
jgi:hypothetical protein